MPVKNLNQPVFGILDVHLYSAEKILCALPASLLTKHFAIIPEIFYSHKDSHNQAGRDVARSISSSDLR